MAPGFNTVLSASDETAAAFNSATQRQQKYSGAVSGADRELMKMRTSMAGAGTASQALTAVLSGNVAALDNIGTSIGMVSPKFLKAGAAMAAFGVGWQVGTMIRQLDTVDKLLGKIGMASLRDPTADTAAAIEKTAGMISRKRTEMAAQQDLASTEIAGQFDKSGAARSVATEQAAKDRLVKEQELATREARNATARAQVSVVTATQKAGSFKSIADVQEIEKAQAAVEEAKANEVAIAEAGAKRIEAAQSRVNQAIKAGTEEAGKLAQSLAEAEAGQTLGKMQEYKTTIDEAVGGIGDARTRKAALALAGAGGQLRGPEREALLNKVAQTAELDKLGQMRREASDPAAQEQKRSIERERKSTERALARAEEKEKKQGVTLSRRDKELLENKRALDEQNNRGKNLRNAELDAKDARDIKQADDIAKLYKEQTQINAALKALLVTAS